MKKQTSGLQSLEQLEEIGRFLIGYALDQGATDVDISAGGSIQSEVAVRHGATEKLQSSNSRYLRVRVFVGDRTATTYTTDFKRQSLKQVVRKTIDLAACSEPDPFTGLVDAAEYAVDFPELGLLDLNGLASLSAAMRLQKALEAESMALGHNLITNSEGASFSDQQSVSYYATSRGFAGGVIGSYFQLAAGVVAGSGENMRVGSEYTMARYLDKLMDARRVGLEAAKDAVRQLGARKVKSQKAPVVFNRRMAARILSQFVGAASGSHVYRDSSFLAGLINEKVASDLVTIIDDGHIQGALGSRPFDSEGLPTNRRNVVEKGKLGCYLIDSYAARKLGVRPNGGSTNNLYIERGGSSFEEIIASVDNGLYLLEVSGPGFNVVNGNYSMGASGLWIENGELAYPVSEITVAGNLLDIFRSIEMVGNDLVFDSSVVSPTLKVAEMTIAGS